jgi:hypothetical protein
VFCKGVPQTDDRHAELDSASVRNFNLSISFFLDEKRNKKIKNERQLQFFSRSKSLRNTAEKIAVRTVRSRQPHYYQRMR